LARPTPDDGDALALSGRRSPDVPFAAFTALSAQIDPLALPGEPGML
jgi:hypothetical protein